MYAACSAARRRLATRPGESGADDDAAASALPVPPRGRRRERQHAAALGQRRRRGRVRAEVGRVPRARRRPKSRGATASARNGAARERRSGGPHREVLADVDETSRARARAPGRVVAQRRERSLSTRSYRYLPFSSRATSARARRGPLASRRERGGRCAPTATRAACSLEPSPTPRPRSTGASRFCARSQPWRRCVERQSELGEPVGSDTWRCTEEHAQRLRQRPSGPHGRRERRPWNGAARPCRTGMAVRAEESALPESSTPAAAELPGNPEQDPDLPSRT